MTRTDKIIIVITAILIFFVAFVPATLENFKALTKAYPYLTSFVKFSFFNTFGECLALRIVSGSYYNKNFGLLSKIIIWGFLGLGIKAAFSIFVYGVPAMLATTPLNDIVATQSTLAHFITAFSISLCMNSIFAPVFMTLHKITDGHIYDHKGSIRALITPIDMRKQFNAINWDMQWGFIFKKTIPLFWLPAHTITFLLPSDFRVLFAAALGVALGVMLAFSNMQRTENPSPATKGMVENNA